MSTYRTTLKKIVERVTGYKVIRAEPNIVVLANRDGIDASWFSHELQLRSMLQRCDVNLVLDVGANRGQFAGALRKSHKGRIVSFEPISGVFADLKRVAAADPHWQVYNLALGSRDAQETLHISENSVFSSFLNTNEYCAHRFGYPATGVREQVVSVRRLDTLLPELVPDLDTAKIFLKMDTQGYDLEVFKGLGAVGERVVALQTEVSLIPIYEGMPSWTESIRFFERSGFGVVGLFPVSRESLRVIEYDCMMVRTGTAAAGNGGSHQNA